MDFLKHMAARYLQEKDRVDFLFDLVEFADRLTSLVQPVMT